MPLQLSVQARVALAAVVLDLAVYAPVALAAVGFALAVRARVACRAQTLKPAVRTRVAPPAVPFYGSVRTPLGLGVAFLRHAHQRGDGFARRALVLHLPVGTPDARSAVASQLAVRTRVANRAVFREFSVRAPDALHALALLLAVRTRRADRTGVAQFIVRTLFPTLHPPPKSASLTPPTRSRYWRECQIGFQIRWFLLKTSFRRRR